MLCPCCYNMHVTSLWCLKLLLHVMKFFTWQNAILPIHVGHWYLLEMQWRLVINFSLLGWGATFKHYFSLIVRILVEPYEFYGVLFMVAGCLGKGWRLAMCASLIMCWYKQLTEGYLKEVCWPSEWHNWLSKDGKTSLTSVVFSSKHTTWCSNSPATCDQTAHRAPRWEL